MFKPFYPPSHYQPSHSNPPTVFQLPTHLTSFSYSPSRQLLLAHNKDAAISVYSPPQLGSDLNTGFNDCIWSTPTDEGLDALLDTLLDWEDRDHSGQARDLLKRVNVVTWRGIMSKLLVAVYEVDNAATATGGGGRADGWELNAMVIDGTLYLEESNSPSKLASKSASESSYKLQSYYGYAFEAFSTTSPSSASEATPREFSPPNTNVQWCSVVKTNLGGFRLLIGGEVDCVDATTTDFNNIQTKDFVELKTNLIIQSSRDEIMFERQKLLKHYIQSFLLGVPTVIVGFRTRPGELTALQTFKTLEIPRLVRGKPHSWDPLICLSSAKELLDFLLSTIKSSSSTREYQNLSSTRIPIGELEEWPVFRISFNPKGVGGGRVGVGIRELGREEVERDVLMGKKEGRRVGFLEERWVARLLGRRG